MISGMLKCHKCHRKQRSDAVMSVITTDKEGNFKSFTCQRCAMRHRVRTKSNYESSPVSFLWAENEKYSEIKSCVNCGDEFRTRSKSHKYCDDCRFELYGIKGAKCRI